MITLNEKEVKLLLERLSEIPFKYSADIINFLASKAKEKENDSTELSE